MPGKKFFLLIQRSRLS